MELVLRTSLHLLSERRVGVQKSVLGLGGHTIETLLYIIPGGF